jgi:zinc transporter ZupT
LIGAIIAEALPSSKQTLGLALHAAAGVLLAIASTELIPRVVIAKPAWATMFKSQNMPRTKRFLLLAAFIIPVWLGATLGYWGLRGQADLPKLIVLAFTTGTLITAIAEEIIPEAHQTQDTNWSILTFIGSFALSILFSYYIK